MANVNVVDALAVVVAFGAFCAGLYRYHRAQVWKRREFVAGEVEKLLKSHQARNALNMLDYTLRRIELHPDDVDAEKRFARISREYAGAMLIPHAVEYRPNYGLNGAAIRDCFDELLTKLDNLQAMIVAGLIHKEDLAPYLGYWIRRLSEPLSPAQGLDRHFHRNLHLFIDTYGYHGVQDLCASLGHDIKPKREDLAALKAECKEGLWTTRVEKLKEEMKQAQVSKGGTPAPAQADVGQE